MLSIYDIQILGINYSGKQAAPEENHTEISYETFTVHRNKKTLKEPSNKICVYVSAES